MSAQPHRSPPRPARAELRLLRRRRRDLLEDVTIAVVLTAVVLVATAGLGVVVVIDVVVAIALVGFTLIERGLVGGGPSR